MFLLDNISNSFTLLALSPLLGVETNALAKWRKCWCQADLPWKLVKRENGTFMAHNFDDSYRSYKFASLFQARSCTKASKI